MEQVLLIQTYHGISPWLTYDVECSGEEMNSLSVFMAGIPSAVFSRNGASGWKSRWYKVRPGDTVKIRYYIFEQVAGGELWYTIPERELVNPPRIPGEWGSMATLHEYLAEQGCPQQLIENKFVKGIKPKPEIEGISESSER